MCARFAGDLAGRCSTEIQDAMQLDAHDSAPLLIRNVDNVAACEYSSIRDRVCRTVVALDFQKALLRSQCRLGRAHRSPGKSE